MTIKKQILICVLITISAITYAYPQAPQRKDVPDKYKWNLSEIYPSIEAWQKEMAMLNNRVETLSSHKGQLGESSNYLYSAINVYFDFLKSFYRAATYASRLADEDLRISENQALAQQISILGTKLRENTAYMDPEILEIPSEKVKQFFEEKPELEEYRMFINDIQRLRKHTLSEPEEKILASFGLSTGTPSTVFNIFNNAEKPNPKITLSDGEEVELSSSEYTRVRTVPNREDRKLVFKTFFEDYSAYKNTLGAVLTGKVKNDFIFAKNRKYSSALEYALNGNNLPVSVYETLIKQINASLPTLHRFLDLKKRMLGLDTLHYYDLYTSMVKEVDMKFPLEDGKKHILSALKSNGR